MELQNTQAALILDANEEGEISVEIAAADLSGLPAAICQAIAIKLTEDENFQNEVLSMLEEEE